MLHFTGFNKSLLTVTLNLRQDPKGCANNSPLHAYREIEQDLSRSDARGILAGP